MMGEGAGHAAAFNLAKELITGSRLPEEYLPRGVHDRKAIARRMRMVSDDNRIRRRRGCSLNEAVWVGDTMAIGLNGAGRQEAMQVIRAMANLERDADRRRNGFGSRSQEM
jgi:hypothetical protein